MEVPKKPKAEREREEREEAQRKSRLSLRLGASGIVILFLSGVGAWLATAYIVVFLGAMVLGIIILLAAFFLVRASVLSLRGEDETKIL